MAHPLDRCVGARRRAAATVVVAEKNLDRQGGVAASLLIEPSHGGSSRQARAVVDGVTADVVTLAMDSDTDRCEGGVSSPRADRSDSRTTLFRTLNHRFRGPPGQPHAHSGLARSRAAGRRRRDSESTDQFLRDMHEAGCPVILSGVRDDLAGAMRNLRFERWFPSERVFPANPALPGSSTIKAVRYAFELAAE